MKRLTAEQAAQKIAVPEWTLGSTAGQAASLSPTPTQIKASRTAACHTQTQAGELVGGTLRTWQDWEAGKRAMPLAAWELYLLRTGQHPVWMLAAR